jgi:hypothetical protein
LHFFLDQQHHSPASFHRKEAIQSSKLKELKTKEVQNRKQTPCMNYALKKLEEDAAAYPNCPTSSILEL